MDMEPMLVIMIKQYVLFHDQEPSDMASKTVTETTSSTNTHSSIDFNLLDTVCEQFNVDIDTLYAQVACTASHRSKQGEAQSLAASQGIISPSW